MAAVSARRMLLTLSLVIAVHTAAGAQGAAPTQTTPSGATAAWTLRMKGDIRWQQVTPAGALLVSTDAALSAVDIERGQVTWEKPELGGLPPDSVRMVEGSLLMEAARPGLLLIFDPVTGSVVFDSRRLNLAQIVTRRVLPQSGTLLVHGRRAPGGGPPVVALYDLATGAQRWANEALFEQTEPQKKGLGGLMQRLVSAASEATALEVLQAGPDMIVVHTLTGLRALDARTGAMRWSATLPTARAGNPARHVRLYPSLDKTDRIYVSFDDRLMAYRLADGQALWTKPPTVEGWVHGIVQHPNGIIILPESPPANQATGNVRIINGVVQTGLNDAVDDTHVARRLIGGRRFREDDDPVGVLHDAVHPALDRRGLGPQALTVGQAVGHEPVVEAHVDAVGLVERRIQPYVSRGVARSGGGQRRGPARRARPRVQRPQTRQRVDDDHVGPRLQDLQRGGLGSSAHQALHQATQPLLLGLGLLEQRLVRPPLGACHEII